jgi:putative acetyltransferase
MSGKTMTIRNATQDDAKSIAAATVETAETPGILVSRPHEVSEMQIARQIDSLPPLGCFLVAEDDARIIGHAILDPMSIEALAHIRRLTLIVHPGHAGKGVGSALLQYLFSWCNSRPEVEKIELLVRATNEAAIKLYRKNGFVEEGRLHRRIRLPSGAFIDDINMAWFPVRH